MNAGSILREYDLSAATLLICKNRSDLNSVRTLKARERISGLHDINISVKYVSDKFPFLTPCAFQFWASRNAIPRHY